MFPWERGSVQSRREKLLAGLTLLCLLNILLVLVAGGLGVLKTAERGDVEYLTTERLADGTTVTVDGPYRFAVESPTDADAFYNAVVRVLNGGPVINLDSTEGIQTFHYHPVTYYLFLPIALLGYVPYKFALLGVSLLAVGTGTALLLRAERPHVDVTVSDRTVAVLAVAACGFGPALTNLKTGQTTPLMYLGVCALWWGYRTDRLALGGAALTVATLLKPYAVAPIALGATRSRWRLVAATVLTYLAGSALAALRFGADSVLLYAEIILGEVTAEASRTVTVGAMRWTASRLRLFEWLGPVNFPLRLVLFLPLAYLGLVYVREDDARLAPSVFGATLVGIFVLTTEVEVVDMLLVLPVVVVLGLHAYAEHERFWPVAATFLALQVHPTTLEVLFGAGPRYVGAIAALSDSLQAVGPLLQPGLYGMVGVYWLVFATAPSVPRPRQFARRLGDDVRAHL